VTFTFDDIIDDHRCLVSSSAQDYFALCDEFHVNMSDIHVNSNMQKEVLLNYTSDDQFHKTQEKKPLLINVSTKFHFQ
jgi:hypothetical protein